MISPLLVLGVIALVALLLVGTAKLLLRSSYRDSHPSIETRRKELVRAVMADEITTDEYAAKTILLDDEDARERLRRRVR